MTPIRRIIGLTGTNGSGKGEAALFFKKAGYAYYSLSDLIREELMKQNLPLTRDRLIKAGNELRIRHGADVLARRILRRVKSDAVIDSIRNPSEIRFLKRNPRFILLAVDAPVEIRYTRILKRGRDESAHSLEEFVRKEREEMTGSAKSQQLRKCMEMADDTILNDGTLAEFHKKLEPYL